MLLINLLRHRGTIIALSHRRMVGDMDQDLHSELSFSEMGDRGILITSRLPFDISVQQKVWALGDDLSAREDVLEAVPGIGNLLVQFSPFDCDVDDLRRYCAARWGVDAERERRSKTVTIDVDYVGQDMDSVVAQTGLAAEEIIALHAAADYVVLTVGAQPGFGYLWGMPPQLMVPRKATPELNVRAGSVMIGGTMTAVATITSPSGWNIIGYTDESFFDVTKSSPTLLAPGDRLNFRPVGRRT